MKSSAILQTVLDDFRQVLPSPYIKDDASFVMSDFLNASLQFLDSQTPPLAIRFDN
jgi:hypothetical protein